MKKGPNRKGEKKEGSRIILSENLSRLKERKRNANRGGGKRRENSIFRIQKEEKRGSCVSRVEERGKVEERESFPSSQKIETPWPGKKIKRDRLGGKKRGKEIVCAKKFPQTKKKGEEDSLTEGKKKQLPVRGDSPTRKEFLLKGGGNRSFLPSPSRGEI